jgi:S1-C subfamily serine protease
LAVAVLLIVAGVAVGHGLWRQASTSVSGLAPSGGSSRVTQPPASTTPGSGAPSDVSAIASKVDPGLVDINTTLSYQEEQAAGTGMVLSSSGEVLTNNHVIDGATSISVTDVGNGRHRGRLRHRP